MHKNVWFILICAENYNHAFLNSSSVKSSKVNRNHAWHRIDLLRACNTGHVRPASTVEKANAILASLTHTAVAQDSTEIFMLRKHSRTMQVLCELKL